MNETRFEINSRPHVERRSASWCDVFHFIMRRVQQQKPGSIDVIKLFFFPQPKVERDPDNIVQHIHLHWCTAVQNLAQYYTFYGLRWIIYRQNISSVGRHRTGCFYFFLLWKALAKKWTVSNVWSSFILTEHQPNMQKEHVCVIQMIQSDISSCLVAAKWGLALVQWFIIVALGVLFLLLLWWLF